VDRARAASDTAQAYLAAIAASDIDAITALMSTTGPDKLVRAVRGHGVDVATARDAAARVWGGSWTALLEGVHVETVELDGARAIVTFADPSCGRDPEDCLALADVNGRWLVDSFPDEQDDVEDVPAWRSRPSRRNRAVYREGREETCVVCGRSSSRSACSRRASRSLRRAPPRGRTAVR
jgi:hypothetical protein